MQRRSFNKKILLHKETVIDGVLHGNVRVASQLLTLIERRDPVTRPILKSLYPHTGKARLMGVTGPAGSGKSTLINRMISSFRKDGHTVGVLAVDPSSVFSGGAILGDRLRMHDHFLDKGVFIRSFATRGAWGGISPALFDAIHVLDAMGKDIIFIETIGAGQDEVMIAHLAEILLLVLAPGLGDAVQIMKAGLLEIGDLVVVTKGDLEGRDSLLQAFREIDPKRPVMKISSGEEEGLCQVISYLKERFQGTDTNRSKKLRFVKEELRWLLQEKLLEEKKAFHFPEDAIESVLLRETSPYALVDEWKKTRADESV